jgi:hypothetical protein
MKLRYFTSIILAFLFVFIVQYRGNAKTKYGYTNLVWHDEFDAPGLPDHSKWKYDTGYIRNYELSQNITIAIL